MPYLHKLPIASGKIKMTNSFLRGFMLIAIFFMAMAKGTSDQEILTPDERHWLTKNQPRIVLAVETGYAPFVFIDAHNQPTGLAHDYVRLIETKIGTEFKQRRFSSLKDIFEKVHNGEVQIVNAVTETSARAQFLIFTDAFITVPNVILVRKDRLVISSLHEENLSGLTVSLVKSYAVTEYLNKKGLVPVPDLVADDLTALLNVSFGRSDAAVIDLATASYLISQNGITNLQVVGETAFNIQLSIATPINEPELHRILQKGLIAITDAERQEIHHRWINTSSQNILTDWRFWVVVGGVFLIILAVITLISIWNRMLQRQVKERTTELEKERLQLEQRVRERTAELTHSEFRFRAIINASPVPQALNDDQGNILFFNPAFIKNFGYTLEDISRLEVWWPKAYPDPNYRNWVTRTWQIHLEKANSEKIPFEPMELNIQCKDGETRTAMVSASQLGETFGEVYLVTLFDITERKHMEETLRESEEKFRSLYTTMTEGVALHELVYDTQGMPIDYILLDVNQAFESILGLKRQAVIGRRASDTYETAPYLEIYAQVALTGQPIRFETTFEPLGKSFAISAFSPAKHQFATVFEDITERKRTEIELKKKMGELERFNRAMVGRELQMIALKREINELCQASGLPARYVIRTATP